MDDRAVGAVNSLRWRLPPQRHRSHRTAVRAILTACHRVKVNRGDKRLARTSGTYGERAESLATAV